MKRFTFKGREWLIAESANEMLNSLFTEKRTADCYIVKRYCNRVDLAFGAMRFSITRNRVLCYRGKESSLWFPATESFFGVNSPFNQWGIDAKLWEMVGNETIHPVTA